MAAPPPRTNQYFIPGDGISREVITADICRYLGNDALVRPGQYQGRDGFYITAYRNLTSAMIADLKADSARWEAERREGEARGYPTVYRTSVVHQSRQFYGPSEGQQPPPGVAPTGAVFVGQAPAGPTYGGAYEGQSATPYPPSSAGYSSGNYAYASGGNYAPESQPRYPYQPSDAAGYDSSRGPEAYGGGYGGAPVAGPGAAAPRQNPPPFQPRDPREPSFGRGGYNYPSQ